MVGLRVDGHPEDSEEDMQDDARHTLRDEQQSSQRGEVAPTVRETEIEIETER